MPSEPPSNPPDRTAASLPTDLLPRLIERGDLTRDEARRLMCLLMDGEVGPVPTAALLVALRMKGETVEEVTGFVQAMRARAVPVSTQRTNLLDTCGTGGSRFRVFNVSTCAAFVAASAGIPVAKHGNRAVSGKCGSADVLEALGVNVALTPAQCGQCLDDVGIGFLFAPAHHPATRHVAPVRRELGIRTLFNLLGPLSNPAGATRQVMGVYEERLVRLACETLRELGSQRVIVAHGLIGLDEIATLGLTRICELRDGVIVDNVLDRSTLGLHGPEPDPAWLAPGESPEENAILVREVLTGADDTDPTRARRDLVAVNVGASLRVAGLADAWPQAVDMAQTLLRSGQALVTLDRLVHYSQNLP